MAEVGYSLVNEEGGRTTIGEAALLACRKPPPINNGTMRQKPFRVNFSLTNNSSHHEGITLSAPKPFEVGVAKCQWNRGLVAAKELVVKMRVNHFGLILFQG